MRNQAAIEQNIIINATASEVWAIFTDPVLIRQMGAEYISDWKEDCSFAWKAINGQLLKNGKILEIKKNAFLMHTFSYPGNDHEIVAIITYVLSEHNGQTTVSVRQDFTSSVDGKERADAEHEWTAFLTRAKELLEK